jgi:hypothetical protein
MARNSQAVANLGHEMVEKGLGRVTSPVMLHCDITYPQDKGRMPPDFCLARPRNKPPSQWDRLDQESFKLLVSTGSPQLRWDPLLFPRVPTLLVWLLFFFF